MHACTHLQSHTPAQMYHACGSVAARSGETKIRAPTFGERSTHCSTAGTVQHGGNWQLETQQQQHGAWEAYARRFNAFEALDDLDRALADAKKVRLLSMRKVTQAHP
eukprot:scaffold13499_cov18-Tisochrysis_lutea.AAC.1